MYDVNIKSTVGTIDIYRVLSTDDWTELLDIAETIGGDIKNNTIDYIPHYTGIKVLSPSIQQYDNIAILVAKNYTGSAFGSSNMRILNDLAKNRTIFEFGRAIPVGNGNYEVTVWKGFIDQAASDDAKADTLQQGHFI